jgi:hypothetical protein
MTRGVDSQLITFTILFTSQTTELELKEGIGGLRKLAKTCSEKKKVTMVQFCIDGDCDAGAYGEHRLQLGGTFLYEGYTDFREGSCTNIEYTQIVEGWSSLVVGTEEEDDWSQNDSWFASMSSAMWYNPACATYEVSIAKQFAAETKNSMCWDFSVAAEAEGVKVGAGAKRCSEWVQPAESFLWRLKVEPETMN